MKENPKNGIDINSTRSTVPMPPAGHPITLVFNQTHPFHRAHGVVNARTTAEAAFTGEVPTIIPSYILRGFFWIRRLTTYCTLMLDTG